MRTRNVKEPTAPPAGDRLPEITKTLIVLGERDSSAIKVNADRLTSEIPGATRAVIPCAGHIVNIDQPAEFNRVVFDFLTHVPTGHR